MWLKKYCTALCDLSLWFKNLFMLGFERAFVSCYSLQLERFCSISANWVTPHSGITSEQRHTGIGLSLSASSRCSVSKAMGLWQPRSTRCLVKWCMRPNNICRVCVWVYMCVSMYVWRQDPRKSKPKRGWGLWGDLACVQRKLQFKQNTECWHSSYWNIQWCAVK